MNDTATLDRPAAAPASFASLATIAAPDATVLNAGPAAMLRMAKSFTIDTNEDYALAADELTAVKAKSKALEEKRTGIVGPLNAAVKAINDLFRGPLAALEQAEKVLKDGMLGYNAAQARIAATKKREAEEAAAAERKKLADEAAEVQRKAAAETARLAAEAAEATKVGNHQAAAAAAEQAEQVQQAAAMESSAIQQVAAVIVAAAPVEAPIKVKGLSTAKTCDFEVTDLLALVKHIAEHPEHLNLVAADSVKLRGLVKSLGMNTKLPGVRVFEKQSMRAA